MDSNSAINIIWYNGFRGNWDHGLLASLMDDDARFLQHNYKDSNPVLDEAIIIVGKPNDVSALRDYLVQIKKGIVILASDEDSEWDWKACIPEHLKVWTQYYFRNKEEIKERLLLGFPTRFPKGIVQMEKREIFCSFVGQVQNEHRQACVDELKKIPNHFIKIAQYFGGVNGLDYPEYINILCNSKVVLCPSGSMCTDSFRVYEALECGALPIVEARSPRDEKHFDYWKEVGADVLPCVHDWRDIKYILENTELIERKTKECITWWINYKMELKNKLLNALC